MKSRIWANLQVQYGIATVFLLFILLWNSSVFFSALVGVLAAVIPNTYFAAKMHRQMGNNNPTEWLGHAYRSEFGKWLMTGVVFVLAFTSDYAWDYKILLAGFIYMQLSSWVIPLMVRDK